MLLEKYPDSNFIIIGDHPKDALLSKNLNCPFIGVLTGSHNGDSLIEARDNAKLTLILKSVKQISIEMIFRLFNEYRKNNSY
ncbi:MAG: HAD hydrolase-like protein [Promethearchaeota archaeon]